MKVVRILDKGEYKMDNLKIEDKLELIKSKVDNLEGIHCVIGDSYCNHKESGYIDEFYICPNENNNIQIFYNKETYDYDSFEQLISDKLFNGKSLEEIIEKVHFE